MKADWQTEHQGTKNHARDLTVVHSVYPLFFRSIAVLHGRFRSIHADKRILSWNTLGKQASNCLFVNEKPAQTGQVFSLAQIVSFILRSIIPCKGSIPFLFS